MRLLVLFATSCVLFVASCVLFAAEAKGQWSSNAALNPTTRYGQGSKGAPAIVSDGAAGAIIAWTENVDGIDDNIRCQRVNASGYTLWTPNGVVLQHTDWQSTGQSLSSPYVITDGAGGTIVAWMEYGTNGGDLVRAQRINAEGAVQWLADGVIVATTTGSVLNLVTDGAGGAILSWGGVAQRIDANGVLQWAPSGVTISKSSTAFGNPSIISDGAGGVIATWEDKRLNDSSDIYAQRVDASGTLLWSISDVAICTRPTQQGYPELVTDGSGGAIICWRDKLGENMDVFAQRVDASGNVQWTEHGVSICNSSGFQDQPKMISDRVGGAFISWHDKRDYDNIDIYAQRINAVGEVQWTANGVSLCSESHPQGFPIVTEDGSGGAIVAWLDFNRTSGCDLYAQRVDANGIPLWAEDGVTVATPQRDVNSHGIISNGTGGAIFAWSRAANDFSNSVHNVYAQNLCANGMTGDCITNTIDVAESDLLSPNIWFDANEIRVEFPYDLEFEMSAHTVTLTLVDLLGRPVRNAVVSAGSTSHSMNVSDLPIGLYLLSLQSEKTNHTKAVIVSR